LASKVGSLLASAEVKADTAFSDLKICETNAPLEILPKCTF